MCGAGASAHDFPCPIVLSGRDQAKHKGATRPINRKNLVPPLVGKIGSYHGVSDDAVRPAF